MLDQNTDRMWYVIGAVLVGAAIILIANGTLPQMFASVTDSFNALSDQGLNVVGKVNPRAYSNMIDALEYGRWVHEDTGEYGTASDTESFAVTPYIAIEGGKTYIFETEEPTYNKRIVYYEQLDSGEFIYVAGYKNKFDPSYMTNEEVVALTTTAPTNATHARMSTMYKHHINPLRSNLGFDIPENWWFGEFVN